MTTQFGGTNMSENDDLLLLSPNQDEDTEDWAEEDANTIIKQLEDDSMGGAMEGAMGGGMGTGKQHHQETQQQTQQQTQQKVGMCWCFNVKSYQKYFDVDTVDVVHRVMEAFKVWKQEEGGGGGGYFMGVLKDKNGPDYYGPFWVSMLLVFLLSLTSNVSRWFYGTSEDIEKDMTSLLHGLWIVYGVSIGAPTAVYGTAKCTGSPKLAESGINFIDVLSLYGYSLCPYVPASLVCLAPNEGVKWVSLLTAAIFSTVLVFRNIGGLIDGEGRYGKGIIGIVAGVQLGVMLVIKFAFYG